MFYKPNSDLGFGVYSLYKGTFVQFQAAVFKKTDGLNIEQAKDYYENYIKGGI